MMKVEMLKVKLDSDSEVMFDMGRVSWSQDNGMIEVDYPILDLDIILNAIENQETAIKEKVKLFNILKDHQNRVQVFLESAKKCIDACEGYNNNMLTALTGSDTGNRFMELSEDTIKKAAIELEVNHDSPFDLIQAIHMGLELQKHPDKECVLSGETRDSDKSRF